MVGAAQSSGVPSKAFQKNYLVKNLNFEMEKNHECAK